MGTVRKTITLTEQQDTWIAAQIAAGHYTNDSEAIRDLIRREQARSGAVVDALASLRGDIQEGLTSGSAGPLDVEDIKRRGRERLAAATRGR